MKDIFEFVLGEIRREDVLYKEAQENEPDFGVEKVNPPASVSPTIPSKSPFNYKEDPLVNARQKFLNSFYWVGSLGRGMMSMITAATDLSVMGYNSLSSPNYEDTIRKLRSSELSRYLQTPELWNLGYFVPHASKRVPVLLPPSFAGNSFLVPPRLGTGLFYVFSFMNDNRLPYGFTNNDPLEMAVSDVCARFPSLVGPYQNPGYSSSSVGWDSSRTDLSENVYSLFGHHHRSAAARRTTRGVRNIGSFMTSLTNPNKIEYFIEDNSIAPAKVSIDSLFEVLDAVVGISTATSFVKALFSTAAKDLTELSAEEATRLSAERQAVAAVEQQFQNALKVIENTALTVGLSPMHYLYAGSEMLGLWKALSSSRLNFLKNLQNAGIAGELTHSTLHMGSFILARMVDEIILGWRFGRSYLSEEHSVLKNLLAESLYKQKENVKLDPFNFGLLHYLAYSKALFQKANDDFKSINLLFDYLSLFDPGYLINYKPRTNDISSIPFNIPINIYGKFDGFIFDPTRIQDLMNEQLIFYAASKKFSERLLDNFSSYPNQRSARFSEFLKNINIKVFTDVLAERLTSGQDPYVSGTTNGVILRQKFLNYLKELNARGIVIKQEKAARILRDPEAFPDGVFMNYEEFNDLLQNLVISQMSQGTNSIRLFGAYLNYLKKHRPDFVEPEYKEYYFAGKKHLERFGESDEINQAREKLNRDLGLLIMSNYPITSAVNGYAEKANLSILSNLFSVFYLSHFGKVDVRRFAYRSKAPTENDVGLIFDEVDERIPGGINQALFMKYFNGIPTDTVMLSDEKDEQLFYKFAQTLKQNILSHYYKDIFSESFPWVTDFSNVKVSAPIVVIFRDEQGINHTFSYIPRDQEILQELVQGYSPDVSKNLLEFYYGVSVKQFKKDVDSLRKSLSEFYNSKDNRFSNISSLIRETFTEEALRGEGTNQLFKVDDKRLFDNLRKIMWETTTIDPSKAKIIMEFINRYDKTESKTFFSKFCGELALTKNLCGKVYYSVNNNSNREDSDSFKETLNKYLFSGGDDDSSDVENFLVLVRHNQISSLIKNLHNNGDNTLDYLIDGYKRTNIQYRRSNDGRLVPIGIAKNIEETYLFQEISDLMKNSRNRISKYELYSTFYEQYNRRIFDPFLTAINDAVSSLNGFGHITKEGLGSIKDEHLSKKYALTVLALSRIINGQLSKKFITERDKFLDKFSSGDELNLEGENVKSMDNESLVLLNKLLSDLSAEIRNRQRFLKSRFLDEGSFGKAGAINLLEEIANNPMALRKYKITSYYVDPEVSPGGTDSSGQKKLPTFKAGAVVIVFDPNFQQ